MRGAGRSEALDDLGLRTLDLFKANAVSDCKPLEGAIQAVRKLRPAIFLESSDRANLANVPSELKGLDYSVEWLHMAYHDPNNFRSGPVDGFGSQRTFAMFAVPRERDGS
jgi:hypothetical protein